MRSLSVFDYALGTAFVVAVGGVAYQWLALPGAEANVRRGPSSAIVEVKALSENLEGPSPPAISKSGRGGEKITGCPKMVVPETVYDFGTLDSEDVAKHEFEVFNEGDADLVIDPITPTCGCTSASVSQNRVKPGDKAIITVELALDRAGKRNRSVAVTSNDDENSPLLLRLTGIVSEPRSTLVVEER